MKRLLTLWISLISLTGQAQTDSLPNILLVIADDLGIDMLNGYGFGGLKPTTPTLDSLRAEGITFENVWSAPACTPTRAAIMSGKYGIKTGVLKAPGNLDTIHTSVFKQLLNVYESALVGKWHISMPVDLDHPQQHGVSYYSGAMQSGVSDYYNWNRTENGSTVLDTNYVTEVFTNKTLTWLNGRQEPWFVWLAHVAPHSPVHLPPAHMYTLRSTATNYRKYVAMIESFDFELGRMIDSIPDSVLKNTTIIVVGDNGTPNNFLQDYPTNHGKGTPYEGAIRVPMIIAGKGVDRKGQREKSLIHVCDIYSTVIELSGKELPGGKYNSLSFAHLLSSTSMNQRPTRDYNYSEIQDTISSWTIRDRQFKLIEFSSGIQEFYNLSIDSLETTNLMDSLTTAQLAVKQDLEKEANSIRNGWSCRDHIQNGAEEGIDCGGTSCVPCQTMIQEDQIQYIKAYPNPAKEFLTLEKIVEFNAPFNIQIMNVAGQVLYSKNTLSIESSVQIDISKMPKGQLILIVKDKLGEPLLKEVFVHE